MSSDILFIHINEWGEYRSPDTTPISQAYQLACLQANGFSGRILGDYKDRPLSPSVVREVIRHDRPLALGFTVYEENINRGNSGDRILNSNQNILLTSRRCLRKLKGKISEELPCPKKT